jgi:hypothetical protein
MIPHNLEELVIVLCCGAQQDALAGFRVGLIGDDGCAKER